MYFATREVARRLAWLLSIVAAVAALGGRATPARSVAIGARDGVMGASVGALAVAERAPPFAPLCVK